MTDKLKPCPACTSENLEVDVEYTFAQKMVVCRNCGTRGPESVYTHQAIDGWQKMPRRNDVVTEGNCIEKASA